MAYGYSGSGAAADSTTAQLAIGGRKPTVALLGDSYTSYLAAALQYACAKFYPADINFDHRTYAGGGRLFGVGGTSSNHMLVTQLPQFQTRPADVAFLWTGYNSTPSSQATAISEAANITGTAAGCLAAGSKLVFIMGQSWRAAGNPAYIDMVNTLCRAYADATQGVYFIPITGVLADPTSTSTTVVPARANMSHDGTHPSARCVREVIAPVLANYLPLIARRRMPRAALYSGVFDPVTAPDVDVLGGAGMMVGTSGQLNSVNNAGVAGISANYRWNSTANNAELIVTPSIVTDAGGFLRQRLGLSGLMTADRNITFEIQPIVSPPDNGNAANLYDMEMLVDLSGVTGLSHMYIRGGTSGTTFQDPFQAVYGLTTNAAHMYADASNDTLFLYSLYPFALSTLNPRFSLILVFQSGKTLAGNIDIGRASVKRVAP